MHATLNQDFSVSFQEDCFPILGNNADVVEH